MRNFKALKTWWNIAKPLKGIFVLQLICAIIPAMLVIAESIPTANVITNITIANFAQSIKWLLVGLTLRFLITIFKSFQNRLDIKQFSHIYKNTQEKLFEKVFVVQEELKSTAKQKVLNILTNNINEISKFCLQLTNRFASLIQATITLCVILKTNFYIGLAIFLTSIVIFILINLLSSAISKRNLKIQETNDILTDTFSNIVDGVSLSNDLNIETNLHNSYFYHVQSLITYNKRKLTLTSLKDNWVYLLFSSITFISSIYLVNLIRVNTITLATYLVLTPYLSLAITQFVDFFALYSELQNTNISSLRIKTILDMSQKDLLDFGSNTTNLINGEICLTNISYPSEQNSQLGRLQTFSANIKKNSIVLFQGKKNCGKRALFYMLRRVIRPNTGTITIDSINIYDFEKRAYKHNFSYTTRSPHFFKQTLISNLKIIEPQRNKIYKVMKELGIHQSILDLPNGYQSLQHQFSSVLPSFQVFLIGLARSILTKSEIIAIYETPIGMSDAEIHKLNKILSELSKDKTILIFSANNNFDNIITDHYLIENGKVKNIK